MRLFPSRFRLRRRLGSWERVLLGVLTEPETCTSRHLLGQGVDRRSLAASLGWFLPDHRGAAGVAADVGRSQMFATRVTARRTELTGEAHGALEIALAVARRERLPDLEPDEIAVGPAAVRDCRAHQLLERAGLRPAELAAALTRQCR